MTGRGRHAAALAAALLLVSATPAPRTAAPPSIERVLATAKAGRWDTLAMGETVVRFARAFEGAPYLDHTLDVPGPEVCRVTTRGFDCVTLMETALDLARVVHADLGRDPTADDLRDAVTFTRYRGGHVDGYTSRLHYTSEWIAENEARRVLADVTPALGGERFAVDVRFMSEHPEFYPRLRESPSDVEAMRAIEKRIRQVPRTYVPKDRVAAIEEKLETGDLVAITTSLDGLDYAHTGLIVRDGPRARFLHASSAKKRVVLDEPIAAYLAGGPKSHTGITVLRPVDPRTARTR